MKVKADRAIFNRFNELHTRVEIGLNTARSLVQNDIEISTVDLALWVSRMNDIKCLFNEELYALVTDVSKHIDKCNAGKDTTLPHDYFLKDEDE